MIGEIWQKRNNYGLFKVDYINRYLCVSGIDEGGDLRSIDFLANPDFNFVIKNEFPEWSNQRFEFNIVGTYPTKADSELALQGNWRAGFVLSELLNCERPGPFQHCFQTHLVEAQPGRIKFYIPTGSAPKLGKGKGNWIIERSDQPDNPIRITEITGVEATPYGTSNSVGTVLITAS